MTFEQINEERVKYGKEPMTAEEFAAKFPSKNPEKKDPPADPKNEDKTPEKNKEEDKTPAPVIDDTSVIEYLKGKGFAVSSLDELKTPAPAPDPEKEAEKRESEKLKYGLDRGLFSTKEYNNFISDAKDPGNVVYAEYYQGAKKDNPDATDEEIMDDFQEEFGLTAEKTSRKYKNGQQNLALRSQKILQERYPKIISLDREYDRHVSVRTAESEREKKILAETPIKKKEIETALAEISKLKWQDKDDKGNVIEELDLEIPESIIKELRQEFNKPERIADMIDKGWDAARMKETFELAATKGSLNALLKQAAEKYYTKHAKGGKGIPPIPNSQQDHSDPIVKVSAKQQEMIDKYKSEGVKYTPTAN